MIPLAPSARKEQPALQVPMGGRICCSTIVFAWSCLPGPHAFIQDIMQSRAAVWAALKVRFLVVAAVPVEAVLQFQRAAEVLDLIVELQLDMEPMTLLWQRDAVGDLEQRILEKFGGGEAAEPSAYGSAQPSWKLHRRPSAKPLRRSVKPRPVCLPQGVALAALVDKGAVKCALPSYAQVAAMIDARVFELDTLPAGPAGVLLKVSEDSGGASRLLRRDTLLTLHGLRDRIGGVLDKVKPCCEFVVTSSGEASTKGSPGASQCGTLRWCEHCMSVYWAADRCIHPVLLVDAVLSVLEDGVLAGRVQTGA